MPINQALFNVPTLTDKRLFLLSDVQSRVKQVGPEAQTAFNLVLKQPESFARTAEDVMYADRDSGLLVFPSANQTRLEVSGRIIEPQALFQWCRETENFINGSVWVPVNSPVISSQTQTAPTGATLSADVLSGVLNDAVTQTLTGFDPGVNNHRFSVFLKPLPPASVPDVELEVNFLGGVPDPPVTATISPDPNSDWVRYDVNAFNSNAAHTAVQVTIRLLTSGDIGIWGANFTESNYVASYRPRALEAVAVTGEEHLLYPIDAMGIEPATNQDFTVIWELQPLGEQGNYAPFISMVGGDSNGGPLPAPPSLYNKALSFGAHPTLTEFKLGVTDSTGATVVYTHSSTYNWTRFTHQKWAFVVYWDGGTQKIRFFANGTFLGETVASPALTADNYTKFALPVAAIHRRIEFLAEKLDDEAVAAATTIT